MLDCGAQKCQCFILTASYREVGGGTVLPNQSVMEPEIPWRRTDPRFDRDQLHQPLDFTTTHF